MKRFSKPIAGTRVEVTTRYPENYYFSKADWRFRTYTGKVLSDQPWTTPNSFEMTSDEPEIISTRTIALHNVVQLKVDNKSAETENTETSTKQITVKGSKGNEYVVTIKDGIPVSCTCPHHQFRHASCKHMKSVDTCK